MKPGWFRILLSAVLGLALFSSLSVPVYAATPNIKLMLGGAGAIPWAIGPVAPGDSGTRMVTLSNTGFSDGIVTIWISDIVNGEGVNLQSETGDIAEPGELGDHLVLNVSGTNLSKNFTLPTEISNFPQGEFNVKHIYINPLRALSSLTLQWEWLLPLVTGNDVQGDRLSFTVNYMLEELPGLTSPLPTPRWEGDNPESVPGAPGAHMSLIDSSDPVAVGDTFTYTIKVLNQSEGNNLHNMTIVCLLPHEMVFVSADGPTGFKVVGREVRFGALATQPAGQTIEFHIKVKATAGGTAIFNATMRWDEFGESIVNQEGTTIFIANLLASSGWTEVGGIATLSLTPIPPQATPLLTASPGIREVMSIWIFAAILALTGEIFLICYIIIFMMRRRKYYTSTHRR